MKVICLSLLIFTTSCLATKKTLNLYMWSNYIPTPIIKQFEQETGIKINISEYDSNETLFAKLKTSPHSGYDVIIPSSYYLAKMRQNHMLHKLDKQNLSNFKYLNPALLDKTFDPKNNYSVPYVWGTTGIVVNKKYINPKSIKTWADLWQPQYRNQLLILDDIREGFAAALITLGYSINDTNPQHIKQAYEQLKNLRPNIKIFSADAEQTAYIDEDLIIGQGWSGDIYLAQQENPNLVYIYPKDGFSIWIDCLAITKKAPHITNAYKFINFLLRPDVAKKITLLQGYSSPNLAAVKMLPAKIRNNPVINPSRKTLQRGQFQDDIGAASQIYAKYWQLLKIGG